MKHTLEPYISTEQALMVAKHISAVSYVETTSAYGSAAVTEAFEVAAEAALGLMNKKSTSKKVYILELMNSLYGFFINLSFDLMFKCFLNA